ncbi:MAG: hypothetical protein GX915_08925 [Clostridiales bacterium]|nr:hypothetical protein [Clostridiales bacterium]
MNNEDTDSRKLVINLQLKRSSSIEEIIGCSKLFNGFTNDTIDFDNNRISELLKTEETVNWLAEP